MSWRFREMLVLVALVAVGWVGLMFVLSHVPRKSNVPALPHYPGTENVPEQVVSGTTDQHRYWFQSAEDYPSTQIYQWYRDRLTSNGEWEPLGNTEPAWVRSQEKDQIVDMFTAGWLSKNHLFELDVQLISTAPLAKAGESTVVQPRAPGLKVYVTLRRNLAPWLQPETGGGH